MRRLTWMLLLLSGGLAAPVGEAIADVTVSEKMASYDISGSSGAALLRAMDRHGPKHGFLTRAIAQTSYSISWKIEWGETRTACRVKRTEGKLAITYTYPRVIGGAPPALAREWRAFLAGVRRHESTHGTLARQMAKAAEKSVEKLTIRNDPGCRKAKLEVKRRMAAVYAEYERRQVAFDAREHRAGGKVEQLIDALTAN